MSSGPSSPVVVGWALILFGCCTNVLTLEFLSKRDRTSGHLITFAQFTFLALEGLLMHQIDWRTWRLKKRVVPMRTYLSLTALFGLSSALNNLALNFAISMPVHTVFRSGGLAATLLTGWVLFGKRYTVRQVLACMLVCVGVIALTLADAQSSASARTLPTTCCGDHASNSMADLQTTNSTDASSAADAAAAGAGVASLFGNSSVLDGIAKALPFFHIGPLIASLLDTSGWDLRWLVGIAMLTSTLLMLAVLGHLQDRTYRTHGKVWREVMFYTHALALPAFLLVRGDIHAHIVSWTNPATYPVVVLPGGYEFVAPLFFHLFLNLATQSICFKGVSILTSHTSALTCTVALTLRKFLSLLLSIWYFGTPFSRGHWAGALLVFAGILAYAHDGWRRAASPAAADTARPKMRARFQATAGTAHSIEDLLQAASEATGKPIPAPSPTPAVANDEDRSRRAAGLRQRRVFTNELPPSRLAGEEDDREEEDDDDDSSDRSVDRRSGLDAFERIKLRRTPHVEKLASDLELLQLMGDLGGDAHPQHQHQHQQRIPMDVSPPPNPPMPLARGPSTGSSSSSGSAKKKRASASTPRERLSRHLHL